MILSLDDYIDREIDPTAPFQATGEHDELLAAMLLDPSTQPPGGIEDAVVRERLGNAMRLQQKLVFRIGQRLGVLDSAVPEVRKALQLVPPFVKDAIEDAEALVLEAVSTGIGLAGDAMSLVPIVGWIVKVAAASITAAIRIVAGLERSMSPGNRIGPALVGAQEYHTDADESRVNEHLIPYAETSDWTGIFMPGMRGELAAQVRTSAAGELVIAWGLRDDGVVPRVVIDKKPLLSSWTWHFSDENGGAFTPGDGMGAVPGTARLVSVVQSTLIEPQNLSRGHESLGDPRCGSDRKTIDIDTGTFWPSTANGAWSLFGYCTKAGAPAYTIATQEVLDAWQKVADAVWEGIERLWRNQSWEGGWGCGPWQNALQGLARSYCTGSDGQIGTFGAWAPTRYETKLTTADRNAWEANNFVTRIVKPAMQDLREMQLSLLRKTPMAAYLPATGLGAMRDASVKDAFQAARAQLMTRTATADRRHSQIRWGDVVDDWYLTFLQAQGIGSATASGGLDKSAYKPPRTAVSAGSGGGGRAAIAIGVGAITLTALGLAIRARRRR